MLTVKLLGNARLTSLYETTISNIHSFEKDGFGYITKSRENAEKLYSEDNCIAISQIQKLRELLLEEFNLFKGEMETFNGIELSKTLRKAFIHDIWCLVSEKQKN